MNLNVLMSVIFLIWPVGLFLYKLFMYYTYVQIKLPCGSFKVKRIFRFDMNVMTRIVSKEFFDGKNVDAEVMQALYKQYGPLSWRKCSTWLQTHLQGVVFWVARRINPDGWFLSKNL